METMKTTPEGRNIGLRADPISTTREKLLSIINEGELKGSQELAIKRAADRLELVKQETEAGKATSTKETLKQLYGLHFKFQESLRDTPAASALRLVGYDYAKLEGITYDDAQEIYQECLLEHDESVNRDSSMEQEPTNDNNERSQ